MEDRLKELSDIKVSSIMIKDPLYTFPNEKISATELLMIRKNIGGLPVVKDRKNRLLIGIITQRDIRLARFAMSLDSPNTTVKDLMTLEPFVVRKDDTLKYVLEVMFGKKIERLPVVNENNELIGLVMQNEILQKLLEYMKKD
ncbi:MAG: CBS domain-containing protein [Candidatus Lokiarchaeota archaeon]|nr:CBS domain-containing protein [Candidatus Lokiarchaeota archaeon]MCK4479422.1 CBS domain-containing protein [Candidatus Lokiarchaeota archaeon]